MVTLKDGSETEDPRLDRLVEFDERSRNFAIRETLAMRNVPRTRFWRRNQRWVTDQGLEGACVGHAIAHELNCKPGVIHFRNVATAEKYALKNLYWEAQKIDPWPGGAYPGADPVYDGTSVLAGMKVAQRAGHFESYRWSFGMDELMDGLSWHGPAVLGLAWYASMYAPSSDHFIKPEGQLVGGHAILARGLFIKRHRDRTIDRHSSYVLLLNSWGRGWGRRGEAKVRLEDLEPWLADRGEAVFAVNRSRGCIK